MDGVPVRVPLASNDPKTRKAERFFIDQGITMAEVVIVTAWLVAEAQWRASQ